MNEIVQRETPVGTIQTMPARLTVQDRLGALLVRLGIGRDRYRIPPGLYAVGTPGRNSPVLVTANYKLSVDSLRRYLGGIDAWVLVADTYGINVWCAAGKGTFSAEEIARRVLATQLASIVDHRALVLPQLAAAGVAAHRVRELTGFRVAWGPVRASDLPSYLRAGMKASPEMRRVRFSFVDRLTLVPLEMRYALKIAAQLMAGLALVAFLIRGGASIPLLPWLVLPIAGASFLGAALVPAVLPWIPFRSFVLKGAVVGLIWAGIVAAAHGGGWSGTLGFLLLLPATSAFFTLNFTGSTTFTSQGGVNEEIRLFARPMGIAAFAGLTLTVIAIITS